MSEQLISTPVASIADKAQSLSSAKVEYNIVDFAQSSQGFGIKLFPSQRFFLKVFEKLPLDAVTKDIEIRDKFNEHVVKVFTEEDFYKYLLDNGRISLPYADYCNTPIIQVQFAMGRRASKSTMISIFVGFKLYQILTIAHPQDYFEILPEDSINITMTALGQDNANKLFKKFTGILKPSPFFRAHLLEDPNTNELKIWTRHDLDNLKNRSRKPGAHSNSINVLSVPNSPGVRGENNVFVVGDEFAHCNSGSKSTRDKPLDVSIYEALTPSVAGFKHPSAEKQEKLGVTFNAIPNSPFGMTLLLSSPNGKKGKFFEEYANAFRLKQNSYSLAIQAATYEINPTIQPAYLKSEYNKSPASYSQEFEAKFTEGGMNWLQDLAVFYAAVDVRIRPHERVGAMNRQYFVGGDIALSSDGSAFALAHWEPYYKHLQISYCDEAWAYCENLEEKFDTISGVYVVDYIQQRRSGHGEYSNQSTLMIEDILDWLEDIYAHYPIRFGCADQWSGEIIKQMIRTRGLDKRFEIVNHNATINDSQYKLFSMLLHSGKLKIPNYPELLNELLSLTVEHRPNKIINVEAPPGGHDDMFDAIIRALWLCFSHNSNNLALASSEGINLFNNELMIKTAGNQKPVSEAHYRMLQKVNHQTHLSVRNPKRMVMGRRPSRAR
ncbi:MAG TPA: hypothetical protein ENI23_12215 [bacterium]|nr:hypothetical protein [bacterium]